MDDVRARLVAYRKSKEQEDGTTSTKTQSKAYPSPLGAYRPVSWPTHLKVLWAQRSNKILLTVKVDEIHDEEFSLEENKLHFSALSGSEDKRCEVIINFYKDIVPHKSKHTRTDGEVFFDIKKKEDGPYWPRLTSDTIDCAIISVDFSRWKKEGEEEEEEEESNKDSKVSKKQTKPASHKKAAEADLPPKSNPRPWYITALYVILWLLLFGFFVEVEFGIVFIILSGFVFIVLSLRGSRRRIGELSAYSVFNENCEQIDGTLTAEQFEREIRYGPTAVR